MKGTHGLVNEHRTRILSVYSSLRTSKLGSEPHLLPRTRHYQLKRSDMRNVLHADLQPSFDTSVSDNITTTSGKTAYLPCRVRHLADRTVSWIRRQDLHVLTVGRYTYSSDERFQMIHPEDSDDWTLQVKYPQREDTGLYECQVSTVPKMSKFITLNVLVPDVSDASSHEHRRNHQRKTLLEVSKAIIKEGSIQYIKSGSTINLTCIVLESPVPPDYVFWYHNGHVINYDTREGIEVKTEKSPRTTSTLRIEKARPEDSGNYSCIPSNADPAEIGVHVLNGENPAAMQHGKHTSSGTRFSTSSTLVPGMLCSVFLLVNR
ncbi:zwei Ig domain protein zig-8-like isoform X2 [Tachypleus tridentatus]|uniref:zwei Ig domain protein zig-8-like isoform X2 n=1 Tax=Tachypleus tridentatus TaxID=6853 RepID=UPI003FD3F4E6